VDVLSSRILLRPSDLSHSRRFYRDLLGLAVYREFGPPSDPGVVFFLGQGLLEVSGHAAGPPGRSVMIWIQVRDVRAEHARLAAAGVPIVREPAAEAWGLTEMWVEDPDGIRIVLVEVPAGHPLRSDLRSALPPGRRTVCHIAARSAETRPPGVRSVGGMCGWCRIGHGRRMDAARDPPSPGGARPGNRARASLTRGCAWPARSSRIVTAEGPVRTFRAASHRSCPCTDHDPGGT